MTLSPKTRFLKSPEGKEFAEIAVKPAFHRALETALACLQLEAPKKSNDDANWNRLQGAKDFAEILLNLTETNETPRRDHRRDNLITD